MSAGSLEAECPGGLDWAWYGLGECIRTARDKVSIAFGVLSIISWCLFAFPQIYENCVSKIPDTAMSIYLLLFWLAGDSLNFIGGFLAKQLFMQKLIAGYTVVIDIILCIQYFYYLILHKHQAKHPTEVEFFDENDEVSTRTKSSKGGKVLATVLLGVATLGLLQAPLPGREPSHFESPVQSQRHLFQSQTTTPDPWADFLPTVGEKIGYAFGWTSGIMYAFGRGHQIYWNWRRKATEGLSFYLFILAVLGNTFYACQIFTKSIEAVFVVTSLPWILGSLGILLFDVVILIQFFLYRGNTDVIEEKDWVSDSEMGDQDLPKS